VVNFNFIGAIFAPGGAFWIEYDVKDRFERFDALLYHNISGIFILAKSNVCPLGVNFESE
jgi:hypothetical protein